MSSTFRPMTVAGADYGRADGRTIESTNPATGELLGTFPAATKEDVAAVVSAAQDAFEPWRRLTPGERARHLNAFADLIEEKATELVEIDVLDNGTPISQMRGDISKGVAQLRRFAGLALLAGGESIPGSYDTVTYTLRQPYGVVGRILPFNHPLMFAAGKIAAPLIAGNTIVIKPSEETSLSALRLGELSREVLPDGVFNVLTGFGHEAGNALVEHPVVRRLAFIGSGAAGRRIQATAASVNIKHVSLELGGKNPLVVMDDADADEVAQAAIDGMNFTWQGQSCGSLSRLLIHRTLYDEVLLKISEKLDELVSGDPMDPSTDIGCLVSADQMAKVQRYVDGAKADGARLVYGGERLTEGGFEHGHFVRPALFADVDPTSALATEEIFGPVLAATPFDSYDQALSIANSVDYGLTASIFTNDLGIAHRFTRDVEAGYVWVNEVSKHLPGTGFGGIKDSGIGRDENLDELTSYLESKNVHIKF